MPEGILNLVDDGFSAGDKLLLESFETKLLAYHEISLGYAYSINDRLSIGAHIKPLFGIASAQIKFEDFSITNNRTNWDISVDGNISSSIPFVEVYTNEKGIMDSLAFNQDVASTDYINNAIPNFSNFGLAFDMGAAYELNKKWSFSAAFNNLGYISWSKNLNSASVNGSYNYKGPDLTIESIQDMDLFLENMLDTITEVIDIKTDNKSFTTKLAPELIVGSAYQLNHVINFGALAKSTFKRFDFRQEFSVSTNINLYKWFSTSLSYNYEINGTHDVGLGLAMRGGPLQFYLLTNHIPIYYDKIVSYDYTGPAPTKLD
jgi:hypothetical protein